MTLTAEERRALKARCTVVIPGFQTPSPADEFRLMADWCEREGVAHDVYGEGALISGFERRVADLVGKPAATFMPSGVMAQLIAVRIWSERARLPRFGLHATSHLALHERESYQALFGYHGAMIGDRLRPIVAADLVTHHDPLACLLVELPIREAGGQLPTWSELQELKSCAAARETPLHMDGARLWECAAFYGKTYAEIANGFDSIYVSTYKAIGGLAGAVLAGEPDFIAEARLWQRRMGGNLVHQSPMIVSAAMRLDQRLALLPACHERALSLAEGLSRVRSIRTNPRTPQTNMMHIHFDAPADSILERRDEIAERSGVWLINGARPTDVPGWCATELTVGDTLLERDNPEVIPLFARLLGAAER